MSTAARFDPRQKSSWRAYVAGPAALRDVASQESSERAFERHSARLRTVAMQLRALCDELDEMIAPQPGGPVVPRIRQVWVHALVGQLREISLYADKIARSHRHLVER